MCFSPEASFAASGLLAASSIAIARIPKEKSSLPLSLFPAVFAAHQFVEGVVWLHQDGLVPDALGSAAVHSYTFIAYVLWPILVPFSAYLLERERRRRTVVLACQAIGLWAGLALLAGLVRDGARVSATCCSLSYQVNAPDLLLAPYLVAVSVPFLASSRKSLVFFGAAITASCAAAALAASAATFPSVWCFFAAVLSAGLYLHFRTAAQSVAHPIPQLGTCQRHSSMV